MSDIETPEKVEERKRAERFKGEISLEGFEDEKADLTDTSNRGRPSIEIEPYVNIVYRNYVANVGRPENDKIQAANTWAVEAEGTVRSRFGMAAKWLTDAGTDPENENDDDNGKYFGAFPKGVGLSWFRQVIDEDYAAERNLPDNRIGMVRLGFVAGDRLEGRGRKPKSQSEPESDGSVTP